jgi:protein associated with RNAse G/E
VSEPPLKTVSPEITVRALKFDGREHRSWLARLISREASLLVMDAAFEVEINHPLLGRIERGTLSVEYYWTDRWYNVFRFSEPGGGLRNYYCNINVPPTFDGRVLEFVDLDIDILVAPDLSYQILDEDEFAANAVSFNYPAEIMQRARVALDELILLIEMRQFPFDK